ncbi:MAG TPA: hypothetical protein PKM88_10130 [bacterium]|nr:hypothetical protein [bacterium]
MQTTIRMAAVAGSVLALLGSVPVLAAAPIPVERHRSMVPITRDNSELVNEQSYGLADGAVTAAPTAPVEELPAPPEPRANEPAATAPVAAELPPAQESVAAVPPAAEAVEPASSAEIATAGADRQRPVLELDVRCWLTELDMRGRVVRNNLGSDVNFVDQLGLGDENFADIRLTWNCNPTSSIRLAYNKIGFNGSRTISEKIDFNGKTYAANAWVGTDVDVENYRLAWLWQFHTADAGRLRVSSVLELKGFVADASLVAPALNISEAHDVAGALPTVGLAASYQVHPLVDLFGELTGIPAGSYGYFIDGEVGVKFAPQDHFSFIGGYRIFDLEAKDDPDYARLQFAGPFVGMTAWF